MDENDERSDRPPLQYEVEIDLKKMSDLYCGSRMAWIVLEEKAIIRENFQNITPNTHYFQDLSPNSHYF